MTEDLKTVQRKFRLKLPNPFQNQNVSRAHSLRKEMFTVLQRHPSLSPSEANAIVQDMLNDYRKSFDSVGGRKSKKKSQKTTRNSDLEILPNRNDQTRNAPAPDTNISLPTVPRPEDSASDG